MSVLERVAQVVKNEQLGPRLHLLALAAPDIAAAVAPGQFVHLLVPDKADHVLRRPFSVYDCDTCAGTLSLLYQEVGALSSYLQRVGAGRTLSLMGPIGRGWSAPARARTGQVSRALVVGGGVGAAPLYLLTKQLVAAGAHVDVVLGAQSAAALVCKSAYEALLGREVQCATDDGSYGTHGFCTLLSHERLARGSCEDGAPYDYVAVCGPTPLMRIVCEQAADAEVPCELSLERRMACGIGACLSCVVDTTSGKKRSCVDGPVFDAREVLWS